VNNAQPSTVLDGMLQNTRVVLQVKKPPIARYNHCMCQCTGELFAADLKAAEPIVAVLTDLANDWTFQWLAAYRGGEQLLHRAHFKTKNDGLKAFASVLKSTVEELNECRLVKVRNLQVACNEGMGPEGSTTGASLGDVPQQGTEQQSA
jgi:hypothetical protein